MNIRPSAAIRQNYNEIADLCRETASMMRSAIKEAAGHGAAK